MSVPLAPTKPQVYAGDAFAYTFYVTELVDPDGDPDGPRQPVNLSSRTGWESQWRPEADSTEAITLTVDSSAAAAGEITVTATSEQTREMGGPGVFDVQSNPGPRTHILVKTTWKQDVTRV